MSTVVGISGAQGSGKTTVLDALRSEGLVIDDFKVSRAVQKKLNWEKLDNALDSVSSMTVFQEEVLAQKLEHDKQLSDAGVDGIIFTERTFADIAAYAAHWTWEHVERKNWNLDQAMLWLSQYQKRCVQAQQSVYSGVVLIPFMNHVKWQNDVNRASLATVESIFEDISRFCENMQLLQIKKLVISAKTVDDRKNQIISFVENL